MKKRLYSFLVLVLTVSLMISSGAFTAFAEESISSRNTSQVTAEQSQNGFEQKEQKTQEESRATSKDESESSLEDDAAISSSTDQDINGTRAGPSLPTSVEDALANNQVVPTALLSVSGTPKPVDVTVTNFEIQNVDHQKVDTVFHSDTFLLKMDWNATAHGVDLHEGDYFDIDLPNNMRFPSGLTKTDFDITDENGNILAHAHITPGPNETGGKVHVTFGKSVENKYNVKGNLTIAARFDQTKIKKDQENKFDITVNGNVPGYSHSSTTGVKVAGSKPITEEHLAKWGEGTADKNKAQWWSRINLSKATLTNAVVTDTMGSSGMTYIKDSFLLRKVEFNSTGDATRILRVYTADELINSGMLTFSADMKSFTLNLGNTSDSYQLRYSTTYVPGTTLRNRIRLDADQMHKQFIATHKSADSGGNASGDLASKIRIVKVDEDGTTPLKNAVFTVTRPDGSTFELTTGADGTATSGVLVQGTYKVKEKIAPQGYELGSDEYTLQVTPTGGAIQKVTNKPTKISVKVTKTWVGPKAGPVTVHLLADGTDTGKTLTLDAAGNWTGTFSDLRKCKADGTEIVYTVKEDDITNYTGVTTGDATSGFTITNTNAEKVNVPVKKTWVGPKAGPVTVHLLADGTDTGKTLTLDEAGNWEGSFSSLDKYAADGHEIVYTVKEDEVSGYTSEITGDAQTGFTITNTNAEKVNVPVKKTWVGPKAGPVTVHLLADGTDTGKTLTLDEAGNWEGSFSDLDKYAADGHEIVYTVKEDDVANYTNSISGDATSGFTITNTNAEKVNVPVKKTWVGPKAGPVTVHLLADGTDTGKTLTLDEAGNWEGSFSGLDKYAADGHEIVYTVKEDEVSGYTSEITGDAQTGFTITNTQIPSRKPKKPSKKTPYTGDVSILSATLSLGSGAVTLLGAGLYLRKRNK